MLSGENGVVCSRGRWTASTIEGDLLRGVMYAVRCSLSEGSSELAISPDFGK